MNRMKVFLLLAVMIGFSSCQSRSKQNIEQEVEVDSLSTNPTEDNNRSCKGRFNE